MPEGLPRAAILDAALLALPGIVDAAVVERTASDGSRRLVAYIVPAGTPTPDAWREALRRQIGAEAPVDVVAVSSLPLTLEGDLDVDGLATIPVIDAEMAARHCETLAAMPGVTRAQVRVADVVPRQTRSHLADLMPHRDAPATFDPDRAGRPGTAGGGLPAATTEGGQAAIAHGPALTRPVPRNLAATLLLAAAAQPTHGVTCVLSDGTAHRRTYPELLDDAERTLAGLRAAGLEPGDAVLLQLDDDRDAITTFWACALGGFVPVPVGVPPAYHDDHAGVAKVRSAWSLLGRPLVVASRAIAADLSRVWDRWMPGALRVLIASDLRGTVSGAPHHDADSNAVALILLTSGSTGLPKGVTLTHANLLARSAATAQANAFGERDRVLNWFPLDHVGGIVMYHLLGVYLAAEQVQVATDYVLQEPLRWLDLLERHRATMTWAPNFAFGLVCGNEDGLAARRRDLSSVRFILNGGEAVVAATARRFLTALAPHGLAADAMHPAWGMSETSSGVTFSHRFTADDPCSESPFVDVGAPIPGVSVRIVDARDQVVREGAVGRLQVTGRQVTSGYFDHPELNAEAFSADGWFNTGDLGVLREGRLTITGRSKDVIIVNGANLHCHEIEAVVEEVPGVERSFTAACGVRPDGADTDRVCVFFVPVGTSWPDALAAVKAVQDAVVQRMGFRPDYVVPVERLQIPKTAIGKIQRVQLKAGFEAGDFGDVVKRVEVATASVRTLPDWFFERTWVARRLAPDSGGRGRYLVFADRLGLADATRRALGDGATAWFVVEASDAFERIDGTRFRIDPTRRQDYQRLAAALAAEHVAIDHVLHLWSYSAVRDRQPDAEGLARAQYDGTFSLLFIAQSLEPLQRQEQTTRVVFVSTAAQCTPGDTVLAPEKGTATGLLRTLALEMPSLSCHHVDFGAPAVEADAANLAAELRAGCRHHEVAYRSGRRLEGWLAPLDLARETPQSLPIDDGGLYLVTGGLGGVGATIAEFLLRQHHARVLLVGRTPLPESAEADDGRAQSLLQRFRALAAGADGRVRYRPLDVGDAAAVRLAIHEAETWCRQPLAGVFHLAGEGSLLRHAGITDSHWAKVESLDTFEWMFGPKLYGTRAVVDAVDDRPDALFVAFSSVNAIFGGATYSAYSSANSGLRALCAARRLIRPRTYCFDWTMWDELGMSAGAPAYVREGSRDLGYAIIGRTQGVQSMMAALCRRPRELVVGLDGTNPHIRRQVRDGCRPLQGLTAAYSSDAHGEAAVARDWPPQVVDRFATPCHPVAVLVPSSAWSTAGELGDGWEIVDRASRSVAPRTETEEHVARIWRDLLAVSEVGVRDRFFDLGGDSLLAMRLMNRLRETFGVDLSLRTLFEAPTIEGIATRLASFPRAATLPDSDAQRDNADPDVAAMTDAEVDAMLRRLSSPGVAGT